MPETLPGRVLMALRGAIGVTAWAVPDTAGRLFGLDPDANPQASYVGRLFAVRDLVLGIGLAGSEGDARRLWWQVGIGCDIADAAAGAIAGRQGTLEPGPAVMVTATALLGAALGAVALAADDV